MKARLVFDGGDVKMVQGVREVFVIVDGEQVPSPHDGISQVGKLVLIGRGVKEIDFETSLLQALQDRGTGRRFYRR